MPLVEFYDWLAFAARHPFPADIADIHGAMALAMLANVNRDPKSAAYTPGDFLVLREREQTSPPVPITPDGRPMTIAERMRSVIRDGG